MPLTGRLRVLTFVLEVGILHREWLERLAAVLDYGVTLVVLFCNRVIGLLEVIGYVFGSITYLVEMRSVGLGAVVEGLLGWTSSASRRAGAQRERFEVLLRLLGDLNEAAVAGVIVAYDGVVVGWVGDGGFVAFVCGGMYFFCWNMYPMLITYKIFSRLIYLICVKMSHRLQKLSLLLYLWEFTKSLLVVCSI